MLKTVLISLFCFSVVFGQTTSIEQFAAIFDLEHITQGYYTRIHKSETIKRRVDGDSLTSIAITARNGKDAELHLFFLEQDTMNLPVTGDCGCSMYLCATDGEDSVKIYRLTADKYGYEVFNVTPGVYQIRVNILSAYGPELYNEICAAPIPYTNRRYYIYFRSRHAKDVYYHLPMEFQRVAFNLSRLFVSEYFND